MKYYKYFLFDLDGTITDPKEGITKAVAYALKYFGIEIENRDSLCPFIGPPLTDSFQEFFHFSEAQSKEAVMYYREYYQEKGIFENYLYDGIKELLEQLVNQGGILLLATSKPQKFAERILDYFSIRNYFQLVAGSNLDLTRYQKKEVIAYALDELGIASDQAVMIGDRKYDILGAKENHLNSVGVLYGYGDREELELAGAEYIAADVGELAEYLSRER